MPGRIAFRRLGKIGMPHRERRGNLQLIEGKVAGMAIQSLQGVAQLFDYRSPDPGRNEPDRASGPLFQSGAI